MDAKDLLSAALDECGLDFLGGDMGDDETEEVQGEDHDDSNHDYSDNQAEFYDREEQVIDDNVATTAATNTSLLSPHQYLTHANDKVFYASNKNPNVITFGPHLLNSPNGQTVQRINLHNLNNLNKIQFIPKGIPSKPITIMKPSPPTKSQQPQSLLASSKKANKTDEEDTKPTKESTKPAKDKPQDDISETNVGEDDEFIQADTYFDYRPTKLRIGIRHPDPVIETSSLSSVTPPDVWYTLSIPEYLIDEGRLSALQLESIVYASQQHEEFLPNGARAGFLIGDGPGVGKGRTVAGIIFENFLNGRKKAVWVSISADLMWDTRRDLRDIGAESIPVYQLNKFPYGEKFHLRENGKKERVKKGVIFTTYASLISETSAGSGSLHSRMGQLIEWLGADFDGAIVFDECHKAKNIFMQGTGKSTKTAQSVIDIQEKLPNARIVYASATGASEPRNMGYMTRLGLWGTGTAFPDFTDFVNNVERRGVGAMELIAADLKLKGRYMARQLSFRGVNFRIERARMDCEFVRIYDKCVELWNEMRDKFEKALELMEGDAHITKAIWTQFWASHQRFFKYLCIASKVRHTVRLAKEALRNDHCVVIGLQSTGEARTAEIIDELDGDLTDFLSTAKAVMQSLVDRHFPAPNRKKILQLLGRSNSSIFDDLGLSLKRDKNGQLITVDNPEGVKSESNSKFVSSSSDSDFESVSEDDDFDPDDEMDKRMNLLLGFSDGPKKRKRRVRNKGGPRAKRVRGARQKMNNKLKEITADRKLFNEKSGEICAEMKEELLAKIEKLGSKLPPNTLDQLIDELGGPDSVAEMTGRKGRIVSDGDGNVSYERRSDNDVGMDLLNIIEKERFMKDEKRVAIISEAASSGISLHSDKRVENQRRRVHITIELPWSADRAVQQFGRTHRSNQVNAPEYVFLISDLAGEQRFASIVAKRLESLGALTHGDRRATESRDLSRFNIDNRYGREALEIVMKSIVGLEKPIVSLPEYDGDFTEDARDALAGVAVINLEGDDEKPVLDKDYNNMNRFLNRLLGIQVDIQNALFRYFTNTMEAIVNKAKRMGRYDQGIMDLTCEYGKVKVTNVERFDIRLHSQKLQLFLHHIALERGLTWDDCMLMFKNCSSAEEGFYVTKVPHASKKTIFLAVEDVTSSKNEMKHVFRVYKPNTGVQSKTELVSWLRERMDTKVTSEEAAPIWKELYESSKDRCLHSYLFGRCGRYDCDVGIRHRKYCIMSGNVLPVWPILEKLVPILSTRLQIARLRTEENLRVIGPLIPVSKVDVLVGALKKMEDIKEVDNGKKKSTDNDEDKDFVGDESESESD